MKSRKNRIKAIIILLVVILGLGYAYINSNLNINGTATVKNANWDVHWANIQVKTGSVTGENVVTAPAISNQTTVNYSVILPEPGTYYEFTLDAVNGGSIDAMIDSIDSKLNGATITTLPAYLKYAVTYEDGVELEQNHLLAANTTEKYKILIEYRNDIELNQIPASDQTLSLSFTVNYRQANEDSEEVPHARTVYTANVYDWNDSTLDDGTNTSVLWIGRAPTNNITLYETASEAKAAFSNRPFYLKHTLQGGIVTESYVCFEKNSNTYCLRGLDTKELVSGNLQCKEAYDDGNGNCVSPYYEENKETLLEAFGESNCTQYSSNFDCCVSGLDADAYESGSVYANDGSAPCFVDDDGDSYCYGW